MAGNEGTAMLTEVKEESGTTVFYVNPFDTVAGPGTTHTAVKLENNDSVASSSASSVHTANISEVYDVPLKYIARPLPVSYFDEDKVRGILKLLEDPATKDQVPPVDILWIKGRQGGNYYYSFGDNHRFEAHYRMGCTTIRAKLIRSAASALALYLGGSMPDLK